MMLHRKAYCALVSKHDDQSAEQRFFDLYAIPHTRVEVCGNDALWLAISDDLSIISSDSGKVSLIVVGEITEFMNTDIRMLANRFESEGVSVAEQLSGSYTILLIDQGRGILQVITDYRSTHKVFSGSFGNSLAFASHIDLFETVHLDVDPAGLAWYLSNVAIQGNRTIYRQLRILDRNCVYTYKDSHLSQRCLDPDLDFDRYANTDEQELSEELRKHLIRSVGDSIQDNPTVILPITGGYDSRSILSILIHEYRYRNIHTYTYINGPVIEGSDAYVAQNLAKHFSISHQVLQSSTSSIGHAIIRNAELGQGMRDFVYEVDAWDKLNDIASEYQNPAIYIGDHLLGWYAKDLKDLDEAFYFLNINRFSTLAPYERLFGTDNFNALSSLVDDDIDAFKRGINLPLNQLTRIKEHLFLNYRFSRLLMPLGQYFAGQRFPVRRPLTNRHVARLIKELPEELQKGKILYKRTMERLYPDAFSLPHASFGGFQTDIYRLVAQNTELISQTIEATAGVAEDYLPTSSCHELLSMVSANSSANVLRKVLRTVVPRSLRVSIREKVSGSEGITVQPEKLLVKALVIRLFMSRRFGDVRAIWGE